MLKDMPDFTAQMNLFMAPMMKTNKLLVSNMEKLVAFQMSALNTYVDMSMGQMKAAASISSPEDFQGYMKGQVQFFEQLRDKMMGDVKAFADMGNGMKDEFSKLAEENVSDISKATKMPAKKAA